MSHCASVQICDFYCEEEYDSVANSLLQAICEGQVFYKEVSWCILFHCLQIKAPYNIRMLEPLLQNPLNEGRSRNYFPTKDSFEATKLTLL